jgi:hypothetical protein
MGDFVVERRAIPHPISCCMSKIRKKRSVKKMKTQNWDNKRIAISLMLQEHSIIALILELFECPTT